MQKSFIERVFPKPKNTILPQYNETTEYHDEPRAPETYHARSASNASDSRSSARSNNADSLLQPAPMSASIIHHEDPFIAVDRAAQTLQRTIQSLLDFQSESLSGRHKDDSDNLSQRSATPTQSVTTSLRNGTVPGAVPKRQPVKKRPTLRGARRGIGKAMHEFAVLKEEELRITQDERTHRQTALERISHLEAKRESVQHEITTLQTRGSGNGSSRLRHEAQEVQNEIHELEGRLMELKAKHRHLSRQAEEIENTAASDLSSYQGTLALVDKEVRSFLRHPPVRQGLGPRNTQQGQDMYSLRPERRSLGLAKEQWTTELETLDHHGTETEREKDALVAGTEMWQDIVQKIDDFEQTLRVRMRTRSDTAENSVSDLVSSLDDTTRFLEQCLQQAETEDWKLLICAIGPELESFRQARFLLAPDEDPPSPLASTRTAQTLGSMHTNGSDGPYNDKNSVDEDADADVPHADLLGGEETSRSHSHSQSHSAAFPAPTTSTSSSNESLKATLQNLPPEHNRPQPQPAFGASVHMGKSPERRGTRYSESEDDDPGPDFLLSR